MKLKLKILINSKDALIKLNNTEGLDSVTAYRILKNSYAIDKELKVYGEQRAKLIHQYCERDQDGKPIIKNGCCTIKDEFRHKYETEVLNLLDENVEVQINKISIESLFKVGLSPAQIGSIEFMLISDEPEREEK